MGHGHTSRDKVHRHKVHDDADAHAVAGVDEAGKLGGTSYGEGKL